ncbi:2-oxo-4-hydroxy-4-carboxy-5-ureidoimidazoline decarboxylase [Peribacillus frigoritolerans]|uniref:2-oxo-4-hydroxy-4-carboxy-5-ureidoimidazoline decarboxylase n=1 Tax=Peribacillus frigoritolerans TaxID=450367 RepID=UPI002E1CFA0C|nr:2-oxo-4-hydroxy-4-carboxy-5-ureidoimidazoline decarboxylase [Peribacillus frigoritolerans]MED3997423.1 2-oxo-4-hydroxy-4-carboxy-5-ureidoimidazoline decarboxylase [Peribacillus frigoritolerans]
MISDLNSINELNKAEFIEKLGWVYEHSPWIAERSWEYKPFISVEDLKQKMEVVVQNASLSEKLQLIKSHPDLAARIDMAEASVKEQSAAGLNSLSPDEYEEFHALNNQYKEKFGFPFIFAVRGSDKTVIKAEMKRRIGLDQANELKEAIKQIHLIASHRLSDFIN